MYPRERAEKFTKIKITNITNVLNMAQETQKNGSSLASVLLQCPKQELVKRDVFGRTLLHILLLCNRHDLLRHLLKNNDVKELLLLTDYENGWNCLHYIVFHKRIICFKVLMEYLRRETGSYLVPNSLMYDLVRCKDRNKYTPFQLLDNDVKDLIWIPQYINEEDRFHLTYRYLFHNSDNDRKNHFKLRKSTIDSKHIWWTETRGGSDLYMLGSNKNYNLGLGETDYTKPLRVPPEFFDSVLNSNSIRDRLQHSRLKQVCISKNHSLVLTTGGVLYSCGLGSRGRLGHGAENLKNSYRFTEVHLADLQNDSGYRHEVSQVAISDNHSLVRISNNIVYSFGSNNYGQLGSSSAIKDSSNEEFEAVPIRVILGDLKRNSEELIGVSASEIHSVAWSQNSLFFWGLNSGQMGIPHDPMKNIIKGYYTGCIQHSPTRVSLRDTIKLVQATPQCTILVTLDNSIHVFAQYQHVKLPKLPVNSTSEKYFDIFRPTKLTKQPTIVKLCAKSPKLVALVLDNGDVISFGIDVSNSQMSKNVKYSTLWKSYDRDMKVVDLEVSLDGDIILCTRNGSTFVRSSQNVQRRGSANEDQIPVPLKKNKFRRVFNINRVVRVTCNSDFSSFGYIRDDIDIMPFKLPVNTMLNDLQFLSPVIDSDSMRKQLDLLLESQYGKSYITNFLGSSITSRDTNHEDDVQIRDLDILQNTYFQRYGQELSWSRNESKNEYLISESQPLEKLKEDLLLNLGNEHWLPPSVSSPSHTDFYLKASVGYDSYPIPIHRHLFQLRSTIFCKLTDGDFVEEGTLKGLYDEQDSSIDFQMTLNLKALIIFVHYLYAGKVISIWENHSNRSSTASTLTKIKKDFYLLLRAFRMSDLSESKAISQLQELTDSPDMNKECRLVKIMLSDGTELCHPSLLSTRSAYFETVLSDSWCGHEVLHLEGVSKCHFEIIKRHINGVKDLSLFDEVELEDGITQNEFINFVMEIIEISDELLLLELKNVAQLAIKDFIDLDNVLTLLAFAEFSNGKKLFMSCSWYIYNNLEMFMLDNSFHDLSLDLFVKLERHILFFHHCKVADFSNERGVVNPSLEYNWMQDKSSQFIRDFVSNHDTHNSKFMTHGRTSFVPLVDSRYLPKVKASDRRRLSKKSTSIRKGSDISQLQEEMAKLRRFSESKQQATDPRDGESAIEDDTDFEPVSRRRQKSIIKNRLPSPMSNSPSDSPPISTLPSQNLSTTSLPRPIPRSATLAVASPTPPSNVNLTWANQSMPTAVNNQPVLGEQSSRQGPTNKFKIGQRLSQKERRMQQQAATATKATGETRAAINPWKNDTVPERLRRNNSLEALPVLGAGSSSWGLTNETSSSAGPSLSTIMLQEALRAEGSQAMEDKRSLQDIQQEQMFEKWWQEEAERVQRQMNPTPSKPRQKKPHPKKKTSRIVNT